MKYECMNKCKFVKSLGEALLFVGFLRLWAKRVMKDLKAVYIIDLLLKIPSQYYQKLS